MSGRDRRPHEENRIAFGSMWGKVAFALRMVATMGALVGTGLLLDAVDGSCADLQPIDRNILVTLQLGVVSANHGQEIFIDNRRYSVLPSATVTDDEGNPRDLKEVVPGTFVRFHVRKDQVDTIVVILPK